jgi:hypothetical protein
MLRSRITLTLTALCLALATGCDRAPTPDSVMEDSVTVMEDLSKTLATVKDEASANAAKPKIKELSDKMKTLKEQADKMPKPAKEKEEELKKKYEDRMTKAMMSMVSEGMRISMDPKLKAAVGEMDAFGK